MRIGSILIGLFLLSSPAQAQLKKTLHKVFEVPETANQLVLNIYEGDSYDVIPWAGNTIMAETNVEMYKASRGVFDFFLEEGRYDFITAPQGDSLIVSSKDLLRRVIKLEDVEALEKVHSRIYIPDYFVQQSPTFWERPEEQQDQQPKRKKLNREKMDVNEELKEAVKPAAPDSTGTSTDPGTQNDDNG
ncbi:MAG: hypothetical protein RIC19_19815 [Phaeodactylibacter sp.]|uniref:hypothetical protein n=1 Tax=Phaeodactylibacter sp. TaxID=1940289 RepID=UPI0032EB2AE7